VRAPRILVFLLLLLVVCSATTTAAAEQPPYAFVIGLRHPSSVVAEQTFSVNVTVEYWFVTITGPYTDLIVSVNDAGNRTKGSEYLGPDLAHARDRLRQGRGTKTYNFTLTASKNGKVWHLVAETYFWGVPGHGRGLRLFDSKNFQINVSEVMKPLGPEILTNGDFELGLEDWDAYHFEYGGPSLSTIVVHQGKYSLATRSGLPPTITGRRTGGGVCQVIERPDLTSEMNFSFWVYPQYVIRESTTDIRAYVVFHTGEKIFKIYYCISWHNKLTLLNSSDTTFFLLENCGLGVWNFVGRNLKSDFEARFGSSSQYRLFKMEVYLELSLNVFSMLCPFAYWDEVAITSTGAPPPLSIYVATISVSGLPSGYSTHVMVDGSSVGSIVHGESKPFEFDVGTSHTLTVDSYVSGPSGVRYYCSSSSSTFSSSGSYVFEYATQYYLEVISKYGEAQGSGWYDSGSKVVFSVAPSSLEMIGIEGALGARYVFDHWVGDSTATTPEATITMDAPKRVEAVWRTDTTPVYLAAVAVICTLGVIVVVGAMVMRRRSAGVLKVKPVSPEPSRVFDTDSRVYDYIVGHGGEISWSQASKDLGVSIEELKASVERLKQAKKIE